MSLTTPPLPPAVLRAFNAGLGDFVSPKDPLWQVMIKKFFALQAFSLDFDKLPPVTPGQPLPQPPSPMDDLVVSTGWRFMAVDGDSYGGCHVGSFAHGLAPKLTCFTRDVEVLTAAESYQDLNSLDELRNCIYEPRVLRLAWARFEAFWLHLSDQVPQPKCCTDPQSWVVPYIGFVENPPKYLDPNYLDPTYPGPKDPSKLQLGNAYTIPQFLTAIFNHIKAHNDKVKNRRDKKPPTVKTQAPQAGHFVPHVR